MNAIILCAGFATRMYPLTEHFPKPLLTVGGRPVLDYLVDEILALPEIRTIHIVSNGRFYDHFRKWRHGKAARGDLGRVSVRLHDDGAMDNEGRRGAAGDLRFVLDTIERPGKILVSGGDNIYLFRIRPLWERFLAGAFHQVVALAGSNKEDLQKTGILDLGENGRVLRLHEKPEVPPSHWTCPPLYFFQPTVWPMIDRFLQAPGNHDAPGHFIDYLCQRETVEAATLDAERLDIGSIASYHAADRRLQQSPILPL